MSDAVSSQPGSPWTGVWGVCHCAACNALHDDLVCPLCGHTDQPEEQGIRPDGRPRLAYIRAGAIPYSVFVLLDLMRHEWERPAAVVPENGHPPRVERLVIVILFWTLFETLMERFYLSAFADLPGQLGKELLKKAPNIGERLDRLYKARWGTTFWADMETLGFKDAADHLRKVQSTRNAFIHGDPTAIDTALVIATMEQLKPVQLGWMAVYNHRCAGMANRVPLYAKDLERLKSE